MLSFTMFNSWSSSLLSRQKKNGIENKIRLATYIFFTTYKTYQGSEKGKVHEVYYIFTW